MPNPKCARTDIQLENSKISLYATPRLAQTFREIAHGMDFYKGVKLTELLEAIYTQGRKDGARSVFDKMDGIKDQIPHRNPGKPKKHKK
jgi:hypothetical protein